MPDMLTVADYLAQPAIPSDARISYGDHPDQFGDLYLPDTSRPAPVVVLIHGGCWQAVYDLTPLGECCAALRAAGYAVWSLEYRRLGNGGGWPQTFHDVAAGLDYLRALAAQYPLDLTRVIALGHSAGGQLALWLAARSKLPDTSALYHAHPLPLCGVVALAAVTDLDLGVTATACGVACAELVGHHSHRYREVSPRALLPLGVPHYHLVGSDDQIVPAAYVESFVTAARSTGDPAHLSILPDCGHFELTTPHSAAWHAVERAARELSDG
ncbi:alpha/beta hydrolase family protein [Chloroflexus sp.]|uniref:alpha/beta hydrolase family protein n=1 Tax=Chloroflexus sp. TaxID=1904827 RepID=UPI00261252AB|nr:alpha/beta hydrolase [uncultured Chloroflexus sp.]